MSKMDECLGSLANAATMLKLETILEANPDMQTKFGEISEAAMQEIQERFKDFGGTMPADAAARLKFYKQTVGDEMFSQVSSNPKLQEMADQHADEVGKAILVEFADRLMPCFEGHDVSKDELVTILNLLVVAHQG